jgi:hypothetical protein
LAGLAQDTRVDLSIVATHRFARSKREPRETSGQGYSVTDALLQATSGALVSEGFWVVKKPY